MQAMLIATTKLRTVQDGLSVALRYLSTSSANAAAANINYEGHIPLSSVQNAFLALGSGVVGVLDTSRAGKCL